MSLKQATLVVVMIAVGVGLSMLDLSLFSIVPAVAFTIHNMLATCVGAVLAGASWRLLGRTMGSRRVLLIDFFAGIGMIVIHVTKFMCGKCA